MSPERRRALLYTGVPFVVCAGLAALLGGLLRPAEPAPNAQPVSATAVANATEPESAPPVSTARPAVLVQTPAPVERHYEPLPPLPPGTTTKDLFDTYVEEVCSCTDMACVDEAVLRHNRYFGQAERVRDAVDDSAVRERLQSCLAELRKDEKGG